LVLRVVLFSALLTTLNTAIVNVALSGIREGLGFTTATISWVINGYLLTYGGFLIVGGRLSDILGRRRTLLLGLSIFTLASIAAAVAWNPLMLIASRAVQGLGAALTAPSVLAIITHLFHGPSRARALSWFSVVIGSGLSLGMVLGGVILQWLNWRWIFWLNVPAGATLLVLTALCIPAMHTDRRQRLDVVGAMLATITTGGLVFAFVELAGGSDNAMAATLSLFAAALAVIGLAFRLRHASAPLVPLTLFESRSAVDAFVVNALHAAAMSGLVFFLSQLFSQGFGLSPLRVGALFLVFTVPQLASAVSAGTFIRRFGIQRVMLVSLAIAIAGMLFVAASTNSSAISLPLVVGMALAGIGAGGVFLGANLAVMSAVEHQVAGAASGVLQTVVQVGASIGIAFLVLIHSLGGLGSVFVAAAVLLGFALLGGRVRDRSDSALTGNAGDLSSRMARNPPAPTISNPSR
jgi:MFS family permease